MGAEIRKSYKSLLWKKRDALALKRVSTYSPLVQSRISLKVWGSQLAIFSSFPVVKPRRSIDAILAFLQIEDKDSTRTLRFVPLVMMFCFVFCHKFWLPVGLHISCSIRPTAGGTCQKCFTKHRNSGDKTQFPWNHRSRGPLPPWLFLFSCNLIRASKDL